MAAAKSHVDNSVAERRLRPIYDWLDNGNNKRALQEAEKVLKKQPDFLCAKVLRALALLRMNKSDECEGILESVSAEIPTDDATLQAMAICYRELHQTEKICSVYAAAVARGPINEELLTHLFMSYVRVGDFKRQQQTAMTLYKFKPKNPYYFWGVMSVVMQAREVPEATARSLVLPLAERMVNKMVESGRVDAEQEVQLYLMILEMQDKIEEALQVLDGPLGERLVSNVGVIHTKRAALLVRLGRWRESHLLYKSLIRQEQDRWNYYCEYMRTAAQLWVCVPDEDDEDVENDVGANPEHLWLRADTTPQACAEFLSMLQEINENRGEKRLRAPLLCKLELYRRLLENPPAGVDPENLLGDMVDLIVTYFRPFGAKPCCYSDLRNFLPLLPSERAPELLARLSETLDMAMTDLPTSIPLLRRHISLMQLSRCLGLHESLSLDERVALAKDLLRRYDHGASLEQGIIATDFPCNDPYGQLACQALVEIGLLHKQDSRLLEAAAILENALTLSPSNFHFKLLLLRIYSITGAGSAAQSTFELLDVKHMQLDSLGWLHCAHLSATGHISMASAHYEATLKFFTANYKDSVDHLTYSYKFGSFLKISEFVEFRDRLQRSHHYTRCTVERMLTELMLTSSHEHAVQALRQMDVTPADDTIEWDKLRDNRDLDVVVTHDPSYKQISSVIAECTFRREIAILRLRSLQLRCLAAAFELINPPNQSHSYGESKESLLSTLITQILHFYLPPIPPSKSEVNHPIPSRADAIAGSAHVTAFVAGLRLANQLAEFSQDPQTDPVPVLESMVVVLGEVLKAEKQAEELLDNDLSLLSRRCAIEAAVNTLETLSFMALLCGVYQNLAQPKSQSHGKKGKKKKDAYMQPTQPRILSGLAELASRLREVCGQLSDSIGHWESRVALAEDATEKMGRWSLEDDEEPTPESKEKNRANKVVAVSAKLRHSYMATAKELQSILTLKMKHFSQYTT